MGAFVKVLVGAIIVVLMLVGFWVVMWQPIEAQITSLNTQIAQEQQKYQQLQQEAQNLEKWEEAKAEWQGILEKLHQTASMKDFIPSFLTDIEKLAANERTATQDSNFRVTSVAPGAVVEQTAAPENKAGGGEKGNAPVPQPKPQVTGGQSVIQLNFTGRFNTIVDFLQQLGNFKLNKLVTIQRITLSPQGTEPGISPSLTVTMPFEVYLLGGG